MKRVAVLRVENTGTHTKLLADLRTVIVGWSGSNRPCCCQPAGASDCRAARHPAPWLEGVSLLGQRREATEFSAKNVLPALTPLVVDSAHPTPVPVQLALSWVLQASEPGSHSPL